MAFITISSSQKKELNDLAPLGYSFDWTRFSSSRSKTVTCLHDGDIAGLVEFERQPENLLNFLYLIEVAEKYRGTGVAGELLAYVARDSIEQGFEGFVLLEFKAALANYYIEKYGAKFITSDGFRLYFDTEATKNLIQKYLTGDEPHD